MADLWNNDNPIRDQFDNIDVPKWINQDITPADVAAIMQGGCASGAYMPAVTYHLAAATMAEYGDDVLEYIEDQYGEIPAHDMTDESWSGLACHYLSLAVELWATWADSEIDRLLDDEEDAA